MNVIRYVFFVLFIALGADLWSQTYLKVIGDPGRAESGFVVHRTAADELFIGGSVNDSALVQRIDADGNVLWSRSFKPQGSFPKSVYHITSAPDGTLIGCGNGLNGSNEAREGFHFRMDVDGNMLWVRSWTDALMYSRRLIPIDATEYLLFADRYDLASPTSADVVTARVDAATGDLTWLSGLLDMYAAVPYIDNVISVATIGQDFYAACQIFTNGSPLSTVRTALSKFSSSGQHLWTNYLLFPNNVDRRIYPSDIIASNDSLTVAYFGDINGSSGNWSQGLIRMDTLGNVAWARDFNVGGSGQEHNTKVITTPFGYLVAGRTNLSSPQRLFLQAVSESGVLLWTKSYGAPAQAQSLHNFYASNLTAVPGGFLMTGLVDQGGGDTDLLLVRTDPNGDITCSSVNTLSAITTVLPDQSFNSPTQENPFLADLDQVPTVVTDALINDICVLQVDLGNDTTLCGTLILDAGNPGATYEWQDGSTEQTLDVPTSGTYWVRVTVDCCVASDTVEVDLGTLPPIDLGPDTALCPFQELLLQPATGNWTFEWQDGTTDQEYVVYEPGLYWVEATDGPCSTRDTLIVSPLYLPTVELGNDTVSCDGGGVLLDPEGADIDDYLWSDGSTDPTLQVDTTSSISLTVSNQCGSTMDYIQVSIVEPIDLDLGPDTTLCEGDVLVLEADVEDWDWAWSDGSQGQTFTIDTAGTYWLDAGKDGCILTDTLVVTGLAAPVVELGADTVVCNGEGLTLAPVLIDVDEVLWSDGSTGDQLEVTESGNYTITVSNVCGSGTDLIAITIVEPLAIDLGPDTVLCGTDSLVIDLSGSGASLTWSDGSQGDIYTVTEPGTIHVDAELNGCTASDTLVVDYDSLPELDLGPDTVICTAFSIILDAGQVARWQDGSIGATYEATRTGLYIASITAYCGTVSDSVRVSFAIPTVPIPDISLCPGTKVVLDPQGEMVETRWTTGDTVPTITVGEGAYGYEGTDIYGCEHADFVVVRIDAGSDGAVYVPNAFTPNRDGMNDRFQVEGPEMGDFELLIHDRWGREVYAALDPYKGWDGTMGGQEAPQDVYIYTITYQDRCNANNTLVNRRGHVTLLR